SNRGTHVGPRATPASSDSTAQSEKISQFTPVTDEDLRGPRDSDDAPHKQWTLAAALALAGLVVIGLSIYFTTRPPSAERLYANVKAAADRGDAAELLPVEAELTRFLQLYPSDARVAEVKSYQDQLERYRLERRLRPGPIRARTSQPLTPIERAYQEAIRL